MIAYGWLYVDVLSSIDGELYHVEQEQHFEDQQYQQEFDNQGKYSLGFISMTMIYVA